MLGLSSEQLPNYRETFDMSEVAREMIVDKVEVRSYLICSLEFVSSWIEFHELHAKAWARPRLDAPHWDVCREFEQARAAPGWVDEKDCPDVIHELMHLILVSSQPPLKLTRAAA